MTSNKSEADIIIQFTTLPFTSGRDVAIEAYGYNVDADPALEYRSRYITKLDDAPDDEDIIAYRVAFEMAIALGADSMEDLPDPIRDVDYDEASGEWWE